MLQICRQVNLNVKKDKYHFRCISVPFFGVLISRNGVQPYPQKLKVLTDMSPPKTKKELKAFLGIINYLGKFSKFSCNMAKVCESLRKLMSAKTEWSCNATYEKMFDKG